MKIGIGCDHAGLELKNEILTLLKDLGFECVDFGTNSPQSVDYPDFGEKVSEAVSSGGVERGILICGTGIGMSIVANKFPHVRASLCNELFTAWISTPFEGQRHCLRLKKINLIEERLKRT